MLQEETDTGGFVLVPDAWHAPALALAAADLAGPNST
jgi:hypothetical protein